MAHGSGENHHARVGAVAYDVARRIGCKPATAHFWLHDAERRVQRIVAAIILAYAEAHAFEDLSLWDADIRAAYEAIQAQPLTGEVVMWAQDADLAEEACEVRYHLNPCLDTARAWYRAIETEIGRNQQLAQSLAARWGFQP